MKAQIEELLRSTKREGIENVITYLAESDFYTAPASGTLQYHNCVVGGLADHSYKVYQHATMLNELLPANKKFSKESIILVGLLHDIGPKVNTYKDNILASGKISDKKPYVKNDTFKIGHGEKSVIVLLQKGLKLTEEEISGIRWHMNAFDDIGFYKGKDSWNKLSILCFIADYFSSQFLEE